LNPQRCWAIYRELAHSPNREGDDAAILKRTAEKLGQLPGYDVSLFEPEALLAAPPAELPDAIFYMCETPALLEMLAGFERQGVVLVNSTEGVQNTFRHRTFSLLKDFPFFPASEIRKTEDRGPGSFFPAWVKRIDFHALSSEDVRHAKDQGALDCALQAFQKRGIAEVLVQEHAEGDLIKFYGIGDDWFEHFYHKDQTLSHHPFEARELERIAREGASRLNLDVFGGDAIVTGDGRIILIDLNAWPSFALYREAASTHIALFIAKKIKSCAGVKP